ncbi:MAG: DNA-binding response regulator [Burkholderiales bacterium 28-67-8]|nr:MAG: DNA-binding response regulator [Burkholderiales bacterium 28-67-8]
MSYVNHHSPMHLLLVDDHQIVREGLKRLLAPNDDEWTITDVSSGHQALDCLRQRRVNLAIVDLSMPGMSGLDLIRRIKSEYPDTAVLVLSMHAEEQYAMRAFKLGANGYVTKDSASAELATAVRKVASGGTYVSASLAERVVQQLHSGSPSSRHESLSNREIEVLQRIVSGQRLTDIAEALHLSVKTVSTHKARIQEKLDLPSMAAVIRYGIEHGIVDAVASTDGIEQLALPLTEGSDSPDTDEPAQPAM